MCAHDRCIWARTFGHHCVCLFRNNFCVVAASSTTASDQELVPASGFRIEQISFGKILSPLGIGLLSYGFGAFFGLLPGGDVSSIMLIYGFPIALLGFALAYAQLKPVPCKTTRAAFNLRDSQMTDIQKQVHLNLISATCHCSAYTTFFLRHVKYLLAATRLGKHEKASSDTSMHRLPKKAQHNKLTKCLQRKL